MNAEQQKRKAEAFRRMHRGPDILVLANAWDVASARVLEAVGERAIASSSAGVAFSLGYPDGQRISREEMLSAVARITRAVDVPVTADVEAAYGNRPEDAARTAVGVIEAGAIGMNLEDSTGDPNRPLIDLSLAVEKIRAIVKAGRNAGVPLVLNARTDVYLEEVGPLESRFAETLRRTSAYRDAGADCIFIPGLKDVATISGFVQELKCPINILAGPGFPSTKELQRLGVARVSLGSKPMLAGLGLLRRLIKELHESGTYSALDGAIMHAEMNGLLQ